MQNLSEKYIVYKEVFSNKFFSNKLCNADILTQIAMKV